MKNRIFALIVSLIVAFAMCTGTVFADPKDLSEIEKEIKQKESELKEGKEKEKNLSTKVNDLEQSIVDLDGQIAESEVELEQLKEDLKEAEEKVNEQNDELSLRLRTMYKNGSVGFMDVMMNSNSFSEFLTNMDLIEKIYASDKDVLKNLKDSHDKLEKKKKKVESLQSQLKSSKATAETEKQEVANQKAKIAEDNEETAKMLDDLEAEADAVSAELSKKSEEGKVSNSKTSEYKGGGMVWPTPGSKTITSGYGWRICPFHGKEFHGAIDIAAPGGSTIVASAAGEVISSGYNGGFGNSIQIDHGGGLVTMYNHCSSLSVSNGDKVEKGQPIATVGSTGSSTGNHLDFRVFKNGSTVSPLNYVN